MSKIQDIIGQIMYQIDKGYPPTEEHYKVFLLQALDVLADILAGVALDDYQGSHEFEEDACKYCEEMGWRRPN